MINEKRYLNLLQDVLLNGDKRTDRTGVGTLSKFGIQVEYDLEESFPLLTTKRVHFKSIVGELLWLLSGSTSAKELEEKYGVTIWREWADKQGELGPVYGKQYRNWRGVDQVTNLLNDLKNNPMSRRLVVSAWNVDEIPQMALPPCHMFYQLYVRNDSLDLQLYQRSADLFLGVPFNIASYSLLLMIFAQLTNKKPGRFIHTIGDAHIYNNHIDQVCLQLSRDIKPAPKVFISPGIQSINELTPGDFVLLDYSPHPTIKAAVAV